MNELETTERLNTLAAEINTIKKQTQHIMMAASVEIGRRLVEAKAAVGHGGWESWLRENVNYSQRTANNMMRVYHEYGTGQGQLFGKELNSQALADLSYTQAVALLGIKDPDERAEFVEQHDVADMSSREIEKAIKERDAAKAEAEQARKEKEAVARENRELRGKASRADEAEAANDQLMAALQKAETARDDIQNKLAETNRKLEEAEARGNTIETVEVEKIPDEMQEELERLRAEVEQAKATPAPVPTDDAEQKARITFGISFDAVQREFNNLASAYRSMDDEDKTKYAKALEALGKNVQGILNEIKH